MGLRKMLKYPMVKFYREEVSYKKIFGPLKLDKSLNLSWENNEETKKEAFLDIKHSEEENFCLTENDILFAEKNNLKEDELLVSLKNLQTQFYLYIEEFFQNIKGIPPDTFCDICGYDDENETDSKVTCQGCGVVVHQSCYGEDDKTTKWLCTKCTNMEFNAKCEFCGDKNGIFKLTDCNEWIHAICAFANKTLGVINNKSKEPIDTSRYEPIEGICECCKEGSNTLVECCFKGCQKAFHIPCACGSKYIDILNKVIYCDEHNPLSKGTNFLSRRKIEDLKEGYKKLKADVFEREDKKLQEIKETDFSIFVKEAAVNFTKQYKGDIDENVVNHWLNNQKTTGSYFIDFFIYKRLFNKK